MHFATLTPNVVVRSTQMVLWLLLAGIASLSACSKPASDDFFPLAKDHAWTYKSVTTFEASKPPSSALIAEAIPTPLAGASAPQVTGTEASSALTTAPSQLSTHQPDSAATLTRPLGSPAALQGPSDALAKPTRLTIKLRNFGGEDIEGLPAWNRRSNSGVDYWLRSDETGIYRVATKGPLDAAPNIDTLARFVLKKPYIVGTAWEGFTTTFVYHRKNEVPRELRHVKQYQKIMMQFRIASVTEQVSVPAGEFNNCIRVDGTAPIRLYVDEALTYREVPFYQREWYCGGVGLVKLERIETSPTKFLIGGTQVLELTSWE
jgi:hypothetical protein